jgi:hypothetical protein
MGQPVPIRLAFRRRKRIELFSGFTAFWNGHNNDQIFAFQEYFSAETGTDLTFSGASDERWPEFVSFFIKLESFADIARLLLDLFDLELVPFEFSDHHPNVIEEVDELFKGDPHLAVFLPLWERLRKSLNPAVWGLSASDWEDKDDPRLNIDDIFFLEAVPGAGPGALAAAYDVFVSYRHARYFAAAHELANVLTSRGLKVWLDTAEIGSRINSFTRRRLLRAIAEAVRGSAIVAFFEGIAYQTIDPRTGEGTEAFSWQRFERKRARSVMYIYPSDRSYSISRSSTLQPYGSLGGLADAVATARANAQTGPSLIPPWTEHPKLPDVKRGIEDEIADFFGAGIPISNRVAFLIAAPTDSGGAMPSFGVAYAGHVVSHALTYSPRWGYLLARAGVDMSRDIGRLRWDAWSLWGPPSSRIIRDTFGLDPDRGDAAELARAVGRLSEDALLLALLGSAAVGGMAGERLRRLFPDTPAGDSETRSDERHLQDISGLSDRVMEVLRDEPVPHDGQFWLLDRAAGGWRLRALAPATAVRLDAPGLSGTFAVCQALRHGIFVRDRVEVIAKAMSDPDADELRYALESLPDLHFLLGDAATIRRTVIYDMVTARGRPLDICLVPETADPDAIETTPRYDAETILREAMVFGGKLRDASEPPRAGGAGLARFFNKQDGIIIGPSAFFQRLSHGSSVPLAAVVQDVIAKLSDFEIAFRDELDFR